MTEQHARTPLLPEEADRLVQACKDPTEKLVIWLILDTGLRVSELCSLNKDNILWQQKTLRISEKGGKFGKRSKIRSVPMSARVLTLLNHWFALNEEMPVGIRQVQKIVKRVANRAKISKEVTPHVLRHTFATLALQKGISLAAVQKILGHEKLVTTSIYLNYTDIHVVEEYNDKW